MFLAPKRGKTKERPKQPGSAGRGGQLRKDNNPQGEEKNLEKGIPSLGKKGEVGGENEKNRETRKMQEPPTFLVTVRR